MLGPILVGPCHCGRIFQHHEGYENVEGRPYVAMVAVELSKVVRNLCARVCFLIAMRYGTLLLALLTNASSPPSSLLVNHMKQLSKIKCVLWWPYGRYDKLISIDEQNIFLWSLDSSKKSAHVQSQESGGMLHHMSGEAWDPHDLNVVKHLEFTINSSKFTTNCSMKFQ
ncbi:hypothetical protein L2E82_32211 [Cichorium intybus]|uniref:Uncharacterized protein n=1 Tax=Cichorium intybus TaxID=13427 RepID=A0ACB9BG71_CICIN|nr:hypothetical protein L2E82_32211 [Cichorium intybus]